MARRIRSLAQTSLMRRIRPLASSLIIALAVLALFLFLTSILSPSTDSSNISNALRAIIDVTGVLLGLVGIMFANIISNIGGEISLIRSKEFDTPQSLVHEQIESYVGELKQYRRGFLDDLFASYFLLILSIVTSLAMTTYVIPDALLDTRSFLSLPLYFLVSGIVVTGRSLKKELP